MANKVEETLKKPDALDKIVSDIREMVANFFPNGYGTLWFPRRDNPSIILEIHDHRIKSGTLRIPSKNSKADAEIKYKAD